MKLKELAQRAEAERQRRGSRRLLKKILAAAIVANRRGAMHAAPAIEDGLPPPAPAQTPLDTSRVPAARALALAERNAQRLLGLQYAVRAGMGKAGLITSKRINDLETAMGTRQADGLERVRAAFKAEMDESARRTAEHIARIGQSAAEIRSIAEQALQHSKSVPRAIEALRRSAEQEAEAAAGGATRTVQTLKEIGVHLVTLEQRGLVVFGLFSDGDSRALLDLNAVTRALLAAGVLGGGGGGSAGVAGGAAWGGITGTLSNQLDLQAALDAKQSLSEKGAANGYTPLGADTKVPTAYLPALAITDVYAVASEAAQLALVAEEGDVAVRTDLNKSFIHNGGTSGTMADWQELLTPTDAVTSVDGRVGVVTLADLYAPLAHKTRHQDGGADEIDVTGLSGLLADAQKVTVRKNTGADVGTRKRLNLIEGANITLTITDDAGDGEVDITIAAAAGGSMAATAVDIPFTDGDTLRRVTIADAAVTSSSKIVGVIVRPDQADEQNDKGFMYIANVVRRAAGQFDLVVACLNSGYDDPVQDPPNETVQFVYAIGA